MLKCFKKFENISEFAENFRDGKIFNKIPEYYTIFYV